MSTKDYAPMVLRYGIGLVFLWFGVAQILDPAYFVGYLPMFLFMSSFAQTLVMINGGVEIVLAILLILGIFPRFIAAILAIHLLFITIEIGFTENGVRDFGLLMGTVAIMLYGSDKWCLR